MLIGVVVLSLALSHPTLAHAPILEKIPSKQEYVSYLKDLAVTKAEAAGVSPNVVLSVIGCETAHTWDPLKQSDYPNTRDGGRELSFGLAQIHLPDHPDVSMLQAQDPEFAINFLVEKLKAGHGNQWTCYRLLY